MGSQLLLWIGLLEVISFIGIDQMLRGSGRAAGDYGFDPLGFASDPAKLEDLQMKELANGRLAMFAFSGFVTQAVLTGNTSCCSQLFWFDFSSFLSQFLASCASIGSFVRLTHVYAARQFPACRDHCWNPVLRLH